MTPRLLSMLLAALLRLLGLLATLLRLLGLLAALLRLLALVRLLLSLLALAIATGLAAAACRDARGDGVARGVGVGFYGSLYALCGCLNFCGNFWVRIGHTNVF